MNCVPLISDSPSFAPSRDRLETGRAARRPGQELALVLRLAFADERQREVRERREVARSHRPTRGGHMWQTPRSGSRAGPRRSRSVRPNCPSRARSREGASLPARSRRDTARRRHTRASAADEAAALPSAPPGSASRRTGRIRCSPHRCARSSRARPVRRRRAPRASARARSVSSARPPSPRRAQTSSSGGRRRQRRRREARGESSPAAPRRRRPVHPAPSPSFHVAFRTVSVGTPNLLPAAKRQPAPTPRVGLQECAEALRTIHDERRGTN